MQCLELHLPSYFGARMNMFERYNFHHTKPYDPSPLYRKEINVKKQIVKAKAYVSGIGYNELYINGEKVGDRVLEPGWTDPRKTILYSTYDVTDNFKQGSNAIGVMLGRGFYGQLAIDHWDFYKDGYIGQPKLKCRFMIEYADGTTEDIISDLSWKVTGGPIVYDGPHMGEIYDANKEIAGWNKVGLDDSVWDNPVSAPSPGGEMKSQMCEPIRIVKTFKPIAVKFGFAIQTIDAGRNLAGWVRFKVDAPKGTRITLYYGEKENPRASDQPGGFQQMAYVAKGEKGEVAECHFSYKGFRYVGVAGYPKKIKIEDFEICQVNSDVETVGSFSSSNEMLNSIHTICTRAMMANLHSIPTDCPHREKNGWMGDVVTGMEFGMANYNMAALMTKFTRDIFDTQNENGGLAIIAPNNRYNIGTSPLWSSVCIHLPWYMYRYYGDTRLFEEYWDKMELFCNSVWNNNQLKDKEGIFNDVLGDWCSPHGNRSDEGLEVYTTMNFYLVLNRMAKIADILGKKSDVEKYEQQAQKVQAAIYKHCYDADKGIFIGVSPSDYRQGPNAMALQYGIVKEEDKKRVEENMVRDIVEKRDYHFYGGIFTGFALWKYMPENDFTDLTYKVITNETYPGYAYMVKNGATTLWEHWKDQSSHIHHFMGFVDNYLIRHVAGLDINPVTPGYKEIIFQPRFINELNFAKADYESINGYAAIDWKRNDNKIDVTLKIPCNTTGILILPDEVSQVLDDKQHSLKLLSKHGKREVKLMSGIHQFILLF
jgi:alpha-L-rhamnosidase